MIIYKIIIFTMRGVGKAILALIWIPGGESYR
jgi:hypothetical protein